MSAPTLPPTLTVSVICSGNICRSPIAEQMIKAALSEAGLSGRVRVTSAGTGSWHVGQPAHVRAQAALRRAGYSSEHIAHQISREELTGIDLVLAADRGHVSELRAIIDDPAKIRLLRSFDPDATSPDVPDPYGGPDAEFDEVVAMVRAAMAGLIAEIRKRLT